MSFDCLFSNGSSFFSNRSKAVGFSYRSSFFNGNNFFGCNFFGRSFSFVATRCEGNSYDNGKEQY